MICAACAAPAGRHTAAVQIFPHLFRNPISEQHLNANKEQSTALIKRKRSRACGTCVHFAQEGSYWRACSSPRCHYTSIDVALVSAGRSILLADRLDATRHDVAAARNGVEGGIVAPALELVDVDLLPSQRRVQ